MWGRIVAVSDDNDDSILVVLLRTVEMKVQSDFLGELGRCYGNVSVRSVCFYALSE